MEILVTGGCGYVGSVLIPKLLSRGHQVTVVDSLIFGNYLTPHPKLNVIQADIRDIEAIPMQNTDAIVHLASISNDPWVELEPLLSWEVNVLATMRLADAAMRKKVKHFIYASSGSVYGVKKEAQVTEDLELVPISEYNKTKMVAERILLSYAEDMTIQIVRPATVCGYSPRMRLDLTVNMLTTQALENGVITIFGGEQTRPNIHIDDITDLYLYLLDSPDALQGVFNAGFENLSIMEIAGLITQAVPAEIKTTESNDPRSYRMNSDKITSAGFSPQKTVTDGIKDVINRYKSGEIAVSDRCYNIRWIKQHISQNS